MVGIEPYPLYNMQYHLLKHFLPDTRNYVHRPRRTMCCVLVNQCLMFRFRWASFITASIRWDTSNPYGIH